MFHDDGPGGAGHQLSPAPDAGVYVEVSPVDRPSLDLDRLDVLRLAELGADSGLHPADSDRRVHAVADSVAIGAVVFCSAAGINQGFGPAFRAGM